MNQAQPTPRPPSGRTGDGFLPVARVALLAFACCLAFIFQIFHWPQWWRALFGIGGWWLALGAGMATWQALRQQPLRITRPGWQSPLGYALLVLSGALAGHLILANDHPAVGLLVLAAGTGAGIPLWAGLGWNALTEHVGSAVENALHRLTARLSWPAPVTTESVAEVEASPPVASVEPATTRTAAAAGSRLREWFSSTWSAAPAADDLAEAQADFDTEPAPEPAPAPAPVPAEEAHQIALARAAGKLDTRSGPQINTVPVGSPLPIVTLDHAFRRAPPAPAPKPLPVLGRDQVLQPPRHLTRPPERRSSAPAPQPDLPRIDTNEIRARLQALHGHRDTQRIAPQGTRLPEHSTPATDAARPATPIVVRGSRSVSSADDAVFISARRTSPRPAEPEPIPQPVFEPTAVTPPVSTATEPQEPGADLVPRYQSGRTIRTTPSYAAPAAEAVPPGVPAPAVEPAPLAPRPFWQQALPAPSTPPIAPDLVLPEMPVWAAPVEVARAEPEVAAPLVVEPQVESWPAIQDTPLPVIAPEPVAVAPQPAPPPVAATTPAHWQPMPWDAPAEEEEDETALLPVEPQAISLPASVVEPEPALLPALSPWQNTASVAQQLVASGQYQPSEWAAELINRPAPVPPPRPLYDESCLPSLDLLQPPADPIDPISQDELLDRGIVIEEKLAEFKVKVSVLDAFAGPVITRYEVEPAIGVRGAQVVNLVKDLSRALGLVSIRVVETIPGKTCMGLELPNPTRQMIRLSEILSAEEFYGTSSKLTMALGKDITGKPVVTDLAKAPHMLVAGTTGSGKSVGVNAMILSLLYKATPDEVRFIMVDPKMLELSVYDGIPHLLAPVVTDMKLAANALNWCVAEMEKRYRLMSAMGVRNLAGFNQKVKEAEKAGRPLTNPFSLTPDNPEPLTHLPFVVVVV
ncbi:S-DNA-T family DNA segregation ATPase FtsK/SpoIIIE, partial [Silvimonas terrae]